MKCWKWACLQCTALAIWRVHTQDKCNAIQYCLNLSFSAAALRFWWNGSEVQTQSIIHPIKHLIKKWLRHYKLDALHVCTLCNNGLVGFWHLSLAFQTGAFQTGVHYSPRQVISKHQAYVLVPPHSRTRLYKHHLSKQCLYGEGRGCRV